MRKIFTLVAAASIACAANAQTVETFECFNADGTPKDVFVADPDVAKMTVVDISTASMKAVITSGPIDNYDAAPLNADGRLDPKYGNGFKEAAGAPNSKNNPAVMFPEKTDTLLIHFINGQGNPVDISKLGWDEQMSDGQPNGNYTVNWNPAYYQPDGSMGLPQNGSYLKFTPSVDGDLSVLAWINKGNRYTYIVKGSDMKAIPFGPDGVVVNGWEKAQNYDVEEGSPYYNMPRYQTPLQTKAEILKASGKEATDADNWMLGNGNQVIIAYINVKVVANESYYIFLNSAQIGLNSYTFTPSGSTPEPPVVEPGEPTVSITWPMAIEDNGRVLSLTPIVEGFDPVNLKVGEPTFGSNLGWREDEPARNVDGLPFAVVQPKETTFDATAPDGKTTLTFTVATADGVLFQPTNLNFLASTIGTDHGKYNLIYNCGSVNGTLVEGFHPNRNKEANGFYSDCKYDLTLEPSADPFNVVFDIYDLANDKQIGFRNVVIKGKLSGNVGLSTIAVDENAPVEYYNLQGVRIANPEHGLYIKRQGNKVTKVIL